MLIKLTTQLLNQPAGKLLEVPAEEGRDLIARGQAEAAPETALAPIINRATDTLMTKVNDSVASIVEAALKRFQEAQSQSRRVAAPVLFGPQGDGDTRHNFGDWLHHAIKAISGKPQEAMAAADYLEKTYKQSVYQKAALAESSGVTGGYTVPGQFAGRIQELIAEETFWRPRAFVQPMHAATMQLPYLDVTTAPSAGTSAFFGGMQAAWTAEAMTRTEYEPAFKQMELRAWELSAYSVSSNVLVQDAAIGLENFLLKLFAKVIGWTEEYAFLQGNGVGKPLGVLHTACASTIAATRASAGVIGYADIANMMSRLLPSSLKNAVWVVHPYGLKDLIQLRDNAGRVVWVNALGGATEKHPGTLFGRPVFISEKVPSYGSRGDISLLDPSMYVIGDRMHIEVAASEHVNFLKNQMTWRVVERVDGRPWVEGAITLADASSTVSPFVTLAT